jgi:hypothetical protein
MRRRNRRFDGFVARYLGGFDIEWTIDQDAIAYDHKSDGSWRIQLHKHDSSVAAFTKNGHDHLSRVRWMARS